MQDKILGKLTNVKFGIKEGRIGLFFTLSGAYSCSSHYCCWNPEQVEVTEHTKWTEDDRDKELAFLMRKVSKLLSDAKVDDITKLNNIPVEFTFKDGLLSEWRILTEVL